MDFSQTLVNASLEQNNIVSMGLDPILARIPMEGSVRRVITRFYGAMFQEMHRREIYPSLFKPNVAFFEQYAVQGLEALQDIIEDMKGMGIPVLLDAKRGDIGRTSEAYATSVFDVMGVDAVTINPYMGWDSVVPFMKYLKQGKGIYVLVRTSNPGARDIQDLQVQGEPLYKHVLKLLLDNFEPGLGIVAGGTNLKELESIFRILKESGKPVAVLIPGVGTQGGSASEVYDCIRSLDYEPGLVRVNSTSALNYAWEKHPGGPVAFDLATVDALRDLIDELTLHGPKFR